MVLNTQDHGSHRFKVIIAQERLNDTTAITRLNSSDSLHYYINHTPYCLPKKTAKEKARDPS